MEPLSEARRAKNQITIFTRALAPILFCASWVAFAADPAIDPSVYLDEVKFLASPELRGRATGSPELEQAADFLAGKFREFGLKPANGKSFYQAFPVAVGAQLGKENRFQFTQGKKRRCAAKRPSRSR